jgi:serine/threonine-protein kinase
MLAGNVVFGGAQVTPFDPPTGQPEMVSLVLDPQGRVVLFEANRLPESVEPRAAPEADWAALLTLAGLSADDLTSATPSAMLRVLADQRSAWTGVSSDNEDSQLHVEAATYNGRPVFLAVLERGSPEQSSANSWAGVRREFVEHSYYLLILLLAIAAVPLAVRSIRRGQGDRRGAFRLSIAVMVIHTAIWLLRARHTVDLDSELQLWYLSLLGALGEAALVWLFYMALEPYVRRFWPHSIIAWTRLLSGQFRDPAVGRSLVVGSLVGVTWALVIRVDRLITASFGLTPREPIYAHKMLTPLLSARHSLASWLDIVLEGIYLGLIFLLLKVLLRVVLRRPWLAAGAAVVLLSLLYVPRGSHPAVSWLTVGFVCMGTAVWALMRFGLVTVTAAAFVALLLIRFPITADMRIWYADHSLFALVVVAGVMAYGLVAARAPSARSASRWRTISM